MTTQASTLERPAGEMQRVRPEDAQTLVDPRAHADGRIYEVFRRLRATSPVALAEPEGFDPFWVVTRQEEIRKAMMSGGAFLSGFRSPALISRAVTDHMRAMLGGHDSPVRTIVQMDSPDHEAYRAVAAGFFHARTLDRMADGIRRIAREFVDRLLSFDGECDFADEIAFYYPLRVVMQIMGVPVEDEALMLRLTQEYFGVEDAEFAPSEAAVQGSAEDKARSMVATVDEFNDYFDRMMADRRANPREDLVSVIANATIGGAPMPVREARSYCFVAASAGHDTTSAVTAGGMDALCRHPGLLDEIRGDPDRIKAFVEEAIRFYPPSKMAMRTAAHDVELGGQRIAAGDWLAMAWSSGNRDEAVYPDPDVFRIDRKPNKLISFGNGAHVCLGQHLARLEIRLFFEELADRVAHVELAGEATSVASLMNSGIKHLPIRFRAR